jgi:hypothetical protein
LIPGYWKRREKISALKKKLGKGIAVLKIRITFVLILYFTYLLDFYGVKFLMNCFFKIERDEGSL